jgi:hypothetical protein
MVAQIVTSIDRVSLIRVPAIETHMSHSIQSHFARLELTDAALSPASRARKNASRRRVGPSTRQAVQKTVTSTTSRLRRVLEKRYFRKISPPSCHLFQHITLVVIIQMPAPAAPIRITARHFGNGMSRTPVKHAAIRPAPGRTPSQKSLASKEQASIASPALTARVQPDFKSSKREQR